MLQYDNLTSNGYVVSESGWLRSPHITKGAMYLLIPGKSFKSDSKGFSEDGSKPSGGQKSLQITNASKLEFLELRGLAQDTDVKNIFSCEYSNEAPLALKIFATKVPLGFNI